MLRIVLTLLLALCLVDSASAVTAEGFEFPSDRNGKPTGPSIAKEPTSAGVTLDDANAFQAPEPVLLTAFARDLLAATSTCKTVYAVRYGKNQLGATIFSLTQTKTFCWGGGIITSQSVKTSATGSTNWKYCCLNSQSGNFYAWKTDPKSGHWSYRQGQFKNGTLSSTGAVTIYVHADGTWSYSTGS